MYHTYSLVSGDLTNNLYEECRGSISCNSFDSWQGPEASGWNTGRPRRAQRKSIPPFSRFGLENIDATWTNYPTQDAPIPFMRNEELILLRAEASWPHNTATALQDINFVRVNSGGLPALTLPYAPAPGAPPTLLDELLYNKTYSMMWEEGSSSWLDARRYGKLAQLPHDLPGHVVFPYLRIADLECDARDPKPAGCTSPPGV